MMTSQRAAGLFLIVSAPVSAQVAPRTSVAPAAMKRVAPALAGYTDDVLFGDVWRDPRLAPRDRSLVTVAVLIATGRTAQLEGHVGRALDNGLTPLELSGVVTHMAFYAGWPSAVSASEVVDRVFRARRLGLPKAKASAAGSLAPDLSSIGIGNAAEAAPRLASLSRTVLVEDLWRRIDLTPRDRSLVTFAALAACGDDGELPAVVALGLRNGLSREQIGDALAHLAFYAGWPKAMAAARVVATTQSATAATPLVIVPAGDRPQRAPAANFTGGVSVDTPFRGTDGSALGGARVTFQPGARTNWHSHPLGQLLYVTEGRGLVQEKGGARRAIGVGDAIWTAPGVKHWHGATPDQKMVHVAISESVEGKAVDWGAPVTDEEYGRAADR